MKYVVVYVLSGINVYYNKSCQLMCSVFFYIGILSYKWVTVGQLKTLLL